jgi:hypothetical protein
MLRYRLHSPDGDDHGEATYAQMIQLGEEVIAGSNERFRVLDVVPFDEEEVASRWAAAGRGVLTAQADHLTPRLGAVLVTAGSKVDSSSKL